jgi:hypothetical protein
MLIVEQGGVWKCININTGASIDFADVSAVSRFGVALDSGPNAFLIQLPTGTIFPSCNTPQAA